MVVLGPEIAGLELHPRKNPGSQGFTGLIGSQAVPATYPHFGKQSRRTGPLLKYTIRQESEDS